MKPAHGLSSPRRNRGTRPACPNRPGPVKALCEVHNDDSERGPAGVAHATESCARGTRRAASRAVTTGESARPARGNFGPGSIPREPSAHVTPWPVSGATVQALLCELRWRRSS